MKRPTISLKALSATPNGLLTLRGGSGPQLSAGLEGAFQGSSIFGFPRSSYVDGYFFSLQSASYAALWQSQPAVRDVVGFLASNFAQVEMELVDQDQSTGRLGQNDWSHPAAQSVRNPNDWQSGAEFRESYISDYFVFDNSYAVIVRPEGADLATLVRIPAYAVGVRGANRLKPDGYRIMFYDGTWEDVLPEDMIHLRGYNAMDPRVGWSKLETLRQTLIEDATRRAASIEFNRGGRVKNGYVKRPLEAPEWSDTARERFEGGWADRLRAAMTGKGTPVLEEGMDFVVAGVSPAEAQVLAAAQLSRAEVLHAFGLHPDVMGVYQDRSVLTEARKQMVEDILPPIMDRMSEVFTRQLAHGVYAASDRVFHFNIQEKQEGKEDIMQKLVGAAGHPIITPNEGRAFLGMEKLSDPEADKLHHMANVVPDGTPVAAGITGTEGLGKPSTNVMPPADPNTAAQDGSHREGKPPAAKTDHPAQRRAAEYEKALAGVLGRHFSRQRKSLMDGNSVLVASARWDRELTHDLYAVARKATLHEAEVQAATAGVELDIDALDARIQRDAAITAASINQATQAELTDAILDGSTGDVFDNLVMVRADRIAAAQATMPGELAALAINEIEETS